MIHRKILGNLTWSWDFRDLRDRGVSTKEIFECNYPYRMDPKKTRKSIDRAISAVEKLLLKKGK